MTAWAGSRPGFTGFGEAAQRPDLRLVFPALAAWLTALLTLGGTALAALTIAGTAAGGAVVVLWLGRRRPAGPAGAVSSWRAVAAAVLVCSAAAAVSVGLRLTAVTEGPLHRLAADGAEVTLM